MEEKRDEPGIAEVSLSAVQEDYAQWFNKFCVHLFYPFDVRENESLVRPVSFVSWYTKAQQESDVIQPESIERLSVLNSELLSQSQILQNHVNSTQAKPPAQDFQDFVTLYEEFDISVRRLERDLLLEGNGYDSLTGLRHSRLAEKDILRELDRLARQGRNFCLALVRVDHFEKMKSFMAKTELNASVRLLSDLIKLSIRSYDDAYYLGEGEYLLCLKQTYISGGVAALERLRRELERQNIELEFDDEGPQLMSMSCVIAEPVAGDKPAELMENLKQDLYSHDQVKTDTVLKYHELSPLQRYVQTSSDSVSH